MLALRFFFLFAACYLVTCQGPNPVVRVANGLLQGSWKISSKGRPYASFEGIPYARPPVGKHRFKDPQPMKPWPGVWDATKTLPHCLQYEPFLGEIVGNENCLFLNVHTPNTNAVSNLPVIVFIHGGAFMYGSGALYGADYLIDKDVVVVTLNYRLGPLGFLSTGDEVVPGNAGLKDQSLALQWVKENIQMFGGNPENVVLTGCSAGGASVHYHYLSPMSKGKFSRGIAFSGSAFAKWTYSIKPAEKAKTLASLVGCPAVTSKEMIECLRSRPGETIVHAQIDMFDWKVHMFTPFAPSVEPPTSKAPFLQQYPYHAAKIGAMHRVPLITSVTNDEGLYPAAVYQTEPGLLNEIETHWEQLAANIFEYNDTVPLSLKPLVAQKIKQHYLGGRPVSQDTFGQLVQALGDRHFAVDVGKLAQVHAIMSKQAVYVYKYAFRGGFSLTNMMAKNNENYGVSHADDVLHIFKMDHVKNYNLEDRSMTDQLVDMVYNFATTGVPKLFDTAPAWLPVAPGAPTINYLEILAPGQMVMKTDPDFGQKSFWDSLGFLENENYPLNNDLKDEL